MQSHEMLFDAYAHTFAAFGGGPQLSVHDNMKQKRKTDSRWVSAPKPYVCQRTVFAVKRSSITCDLGLTLGEPHIAKGTYE